MIQTASLFCQLDRKLCSPDVKLVELFPQFMLFQKENKGFPQLDGLKTISAAYEVPVYKE